MSDRNSKNKIPGLSPGTPIVTSSKYSDEEVIIQMIDYNEDEMLEVKEAKLETCIPPIDDKTRWIHVGGVHKAEMIQEIGLNFNVHPLIVEDLLNTRQRPKVEVYDDNVYIVLRAIHATSGEELLSSEQISIVLGSQYVLSFQESPYCMFNAIVERLQKDQARIRTLKSDYLTYALLDLIVDNYFIDLEILGDMIEDLEDDIIEDPRSLTLEKLYKLKRAMLYLRRHLWPLREVVRRFNRDEIGLIQEGTQLFLRDLIDHVIRATDIVETYRESLTSMLDIYLSSTSNRMNEVMQLLAVISTVFIPLTLMASVYGMNFYIPEVQWEYGYPVFLLAMVFISILLVVYFKRRGWL